MLQATSCAVTLPSPGASVAAGSSLTVQASASGSLLRVDLFLSQTAAGVGCKVASLAAASPSQTSFSGVVAIPGPARGTYYLYAKAMPTSGAALKSAAVPISVTGTGPASNVFPLIAFTSPASGSTYTAPASVTPAVTACDLDGSIAKVDFFKNGTLYSTATTVPYVGGGPQMSAGAYVFTAVATDDLGATMTAGPLAVTVAAAPSPPPGGSGTTFGLTVLGGQGTGTWPLYTWVNATAAPPPAGQVFAGWLSSCGPCPNVQYTDLTFYNLSMYIRSVGSLTVTATYKVDVPVPVPVAAHPRLLITAAQVPTLQSWATAANPMYRNGFLPALQSAINKADQAWSWSYLGGTGLPNLARWSDTGGDSWEGEETEAYAMYLAFSSIVHDDITHAKRARDMLVWIARQAVNNTPAWSSSNSLPFGSPFFATFNRASAYGDGFGATYDWLQWWEGKGQTVFQPGDKAIIRSAFMIWANAAVRGYMSPSPVGLVNNPQLLSSARGIVNNYASAHMRQLAYYALAFDAADDASVDKALPEAFIGNTIRSYIGAVTGSFLYQKFAVMETPATVAAAYGVPISSPNLGAMSGGLAPEGFLYGSSMVYVIQSLHALHTAGWGDPAKSGPQIALINSTWWDRFLSGYLSMIVPTPFMPTGSNAYMGQTWQMHNWGDSLRLYIDPPQFDTFGMLGWWDRNTGSGRYATSAWIGANVILGGTPQLYSRAANIWPNCYARGGILHFLLYDPSYDPAALPDPRVSPAPMPLAFVDASRGQVSARTAWAGTASHFSYKCSWESVNHQLADCGMFQLWRNGSWITKEVTGYATDAPQMIGGSSTLHNTLAIKNTVTDPALSQPVNLAADEVYLWLYGSQQSEGFTNGGDPNTTIVDAPSYTSVYSSFGGLYNRPDIFTPGNGAVDVTHASRSLLWIKASGANGGVDAIVTYDRTTTASAGRFKRWNMNWVTMPTRAGNVLTTITGSSRVQLTSLLPAGGNVTTTPTPVWSAPAELEPTTGLTIVQDDSYPSDMRFLHVLQASDASSSTPPPPATLLVGTVNGAPGGAHGALVDGAFAALFVYDKRASAATVGTLTFSLPAGSALPPKVYVTGLVPGAAYGLAGSGTGPYTVTQGALGTTADTSGVAVF